MLVLNDRYPSLKQLMTIYYFIALFILFLKACSPSDSGFLLVHASVDKDFEVYRVYGDKHLRFASNQIGNYNSKLNLAPGNYLVLADCSYKMAEIISGQTTELQTTSLSFIPPFAPSKHDLFEIQCQRYPQNHPPQYIDQGFELVTFDGPIELLVGMKSLKLDIPIENQKRSSLKFKLSALKVSANKSFPSTEKTPYFVSPLDEQISLTKSLNFGNWLFLSPGHYKVTVNGSQRDLRLKEGETVSIDPTYIRFETSENLDFKRYKIIRGEAYTIEVNESNSFLPNTAYPLISDSVTLKLKGATKKDSIHLKHRELNVVTLKSVTVSLDCGPWEWECLGRKGVSLYQGEAPYPFMHGYTDVPLLFIKKDVRIAFEGSQNIRVRIPDTKQDTHFQTGQLHLIPRPSSKNGYQTLLVRVEGDNAHSFGRSYDIAHSRTSKLHLITGSYKLSHFYLNPNIKNGMQNNSYHDTIFIQKGRSKELYFDFYLPEEKLSPALKTLKKNRDKEKILKRKKSVSMH